MIKLMIVVLLLLSFSVVAEAANIGSEVEEKLESEDAVRVIIVLKEDTGAKYGVGRFRIRGIPHEEKDEKIENRRETIRKKQDDVLSRLDVEPVRNMSSEADLGLRHKYKTVNAFSGNLTKDGLNKLKYDPDVESIIIDEKFTAKLDDTIPQISADDVWPIQFDGVNLTGEGETICVIDTGIDYSHSDLGECTISQVALAGANESHIIESAHPYANDSDIIWNITKPGYDSIALHFKNISLEYQGEVGGADTADRITIYDSNWVEIAQYHGVNGGITDLWTPHSEGDTIHVRLETDGSVAHYGFYIDYVLNGTTNTTYNWSSCSKVVGGWDYVNNDADPMDDYGHGTHVAGIIASDNLTYRGVAPGSKLMAIKSLDHNGDGWGSDIMAGIDWCVNNSGLYNISVISMSLGGDTSYNSYCNSNSLAPPINSAFEQGILVTVASGNDGWTNGITAPACVENATPVGAVTKSDSMATYTARGSILDILAPGGTVYDCTDGVCSTCLGGGFCGKPGTSMATPHVSGAAVLIKQFVKLNNGSSISPQEIEDTLINTGTLVYDAGSGRNYSRIDAYAAVVSLDNVAPRWSLNETGQMSSSETSPSNNTVYAKDTDYQFNVTWTDPVGIDDAFIEHNFTGTLKNDTMDNIGDEYYFNYSDLAAGTYVWRSYANDTNGNWNQTDQETYVVQKASSSVGLLLNGTYANKTVAINTTINITAKISSGEGNITLYENGSVVATNTTNFTIVKDYNSSGTFNLTLVYDETHNYSLSQKTLFVVVDTVGPVITVSNPANGSTLSSSYQVSLSFTTDETATCSYSLNSTGDVALGTDTSFSDVLGDGDDVLDNGDYNISINCSDIFSNNRISFINFTVDDDTAPDVTDSDPSGTIDDDTPTLKVYTDEPATCRFDTDDVSYSSMDDEFDSTDDTYSSHTLSSLDDNDYTYYIRCEDRQDNEMSSSEEIDFTVDTDDGGSSGGGSSGGSCSDECDNGEIECYGSNQLRWCDFNVQRGCWEWVWITCDGVCENEACVEKECTEDWICGPWEGCTDGKQIRECADLNECGTTERKPAIEKDCGDSETAVGAETFGVDEAGPFTETPAGINGSAVEGNQSAFRAKLKQATPMIVLFALIGAFAGVFAIIAKYGNKISSLHKPKDFDNIEVHKFGDATTKKIEKTSREIDEMFKKGNF